MQGPPSKRAPRSRYDCTDHGSLDTVRPGEMSASKRVSFVIESLRQQLHVVCGSTKGRVVRRPRHRSACRLMWAT
ncbi:hypothetical protein IG631_10615 [Alternaria alternata]|nr:hypothetical protein IG631_10615 [Alternaria alternata]